VSLKEGYRDSRPKGSAEARFCRSRHFDPEEWRKHAEPSRYVRELTGLINGTTTKRVFPLVAFLTLFAVLVEQYNQTQSQVAWLPAVSLPLTPFELTAPLLGLLLVFRTDKSYDRYKEGADAAWTVSCRLKDLIRGLLTSTDDEKPRQLEEVGPCIDVIVDFHTWLCTSYLLQDASADSAPVISRRVGCGKGMCLTPSQAQLVISQEINSTPRLNEQQRQGLDSLLWDVSEQLARCERLIRTPIPLGYTRSTVRFLWLWLSLLPFALIRAFEDFERQPVLTLQLQIEVPAVVFIIGITFLSLEDVAVQIEEPFIVQSRQLSMLAEWFAVEVSELRAIAATISSSGAGAARCKDEGFAEHGTDAHAGLT